jgi:hypothetical protein
VSKWHQELGEHYSIENAILSNNFYHNDFIGPLFQLQMGTQRWIMVADPFIAHELFVNQSSKCSSPLITRFQRKYIVKITGIIHFPNETRVLFMVLLKRVGVLFSHPNSKWKSERKTGERKRASYSNLYFAKTRANCP